MRSKSNKNASKRGPESAQLEKNNFSTEKKYFSNREIKFSQLAVSGFTTGFTSNCFFVKFFVLKLSHTYGMGAVACLPLFQP